MDLTQRFAVQGIQEDKNGTLWLGFSGGLFRFDGKEIKNVTKNGPWD
jgi:ligand-binding sensor domain-containing protein